jgi:flagellar biosynthesis protein FlhB
MLGGFHVNDKSDNGEKTEAPTEHRLKKSKEEGQVPRFTTLSMLTGLLGGILGLGLCWIAVSGSVKTGFSKALQVTQRSGWRDMDIKA